MLTMLALSAVGTWTYAGFLADRPPTVPTPDPAATRPAEPASPDPPSTIPLVAPADPTPPSKPDPGPSDPTPTPPASLAQAADAWGQVWEHPDPAYLARFIESRNRSLAPGSPAYRAPR